MKATTVYLVQPPPAAQEASRQAIHDVFPGAQILTVASVAEAVRFSRPAGRQLLVLGNTDESEIAAAIEAPEAGEHARWAVVVLGHSDSELVETVPEEDWTPRLLARVFRAAVLQHELLLENLRLRGDLKTIARRVSHDLRTPLGCIHTTCELLKELPPENAGAVKAMTTVIRDSSLEIGHLIDRVSFLLKASTDALPAVTTVDMGASVAGLLKQLEPEFRRSGVTIRSAALWPEVRGVGNWIEVIWSNLIVNAVRHGTSGAPIELGWSRVNGSVRFWVANRGNAVPATQETALFREFDRLHVLPSSGLGLSLVQRLVALQVGSCHYERVNNSLSVFSFSLPVPPESLSREMQPSPLAAHA